MKDIFGLKIPIFWDEGKPDISIDRFTLKIEGLIKNKMEYDIFQLRSMSKDSVSARLTSVTRWSVRLQWKGILLKILLKKVEPLDSARFVKFISFGEKYFTVVPIEELKHERAILATKANNADLPVEYGGPVRALFPQLWGYKSAKSIIKIVFQDHYEKGYWESRGYDDSARITATKIFDVNTRETKYHDGGEVMW